jgi:methionyl-tRNA formyltransferase
VTTTVYLGTSDFAVAVLERLAASDHRPALVVTRPDRPKGRGRRLSPPPVAVAARALGIDLLQPADLHASDSLAAIASAAPEALVVCAYGALVKEPLLSEYEILNVHPSLLPRWRGAAPIERAIMAGDERTGVAIMRLTAGLDSGPVALQAEEPIRADDDHGTLAHRLQERGGDLLIEALDTRPRFREQPEEGVTYAEKITAEDRTLRPEDPPEARERVVRALRPHIGARLALPDGGFLGVWAARVATDASDPRLVAHGLELLEVQPPGGRRMPADAWIRGHAATLTP